MIYKQKIIERIDKMDESQQMQVLEFVEQLQRSKGISGAELFERTKHIRIDPQSAEELIKAIELIQ